MVDIANEHNTALQTPASPVGPATCRYGRGR
jgi:hypothetical protein